VSDPTQHAVLSARIAAALADLDRVVDRGESRTRHTDTCWRWHIECLADRTRRTLTEGEDRG
jgi:hypothetical protein